MWLLAGIAFGYLWFAVVSDLSVAWLRLCILLAWAVTIVCGCSLTCWHCVWLLLDVLDMLLECLLRGLVTPTPTNNTTLIERMHSKDIIPEEGLPLAPCRFTEGGAQIFVGYDYAPA